MRVRGIDEAREQNRINGAAPGDKPGRGASSYPDPARAAGGDRKAAPSDTAASMADGRGAVEARPESASADRAQLAGPAIKAASTRVGAARQAALALGPAVPLETSLGREGLAARLAEHLRSLGFPADGPGSSAARALMAEYLPVDIPRLRAVALAMRKAEAAGKNPLEAARLAARALAAGLDPDDWPPEAVEPAASDGDGETELTGGDAGAYGQASGGEGQAAGDQGGQSGRAAEGPVDADELAELLRRSVALALSDGRMRAFAAPNPAGLGWLYAPFDLGEAGFDFRGTMRILYNYGAGRGERLVVEADGMGGRMTLSLSGSGEALRARAYGLKDAEAKALRRYGVTAEPGTPSVEGAGWETDDA